MHDENYYNCRDPGRFGEMGMNRPDLARRFFDCCGAVFGSNLIAWRRQGA